MIVKIASGLPTCVVYIHTLKQKTYALPSNDNPGTQSVVCRARAHKDVGDSSGWSLQAQLSHNERNGTSAPLNEQIKRRSNSAKYEKLAQLASGREEQNTGRFRAFIADPPIKVRMQTKSSVYMVFLSGLGRYVKQSITEPILMNLLRT